MGFDQPLVELGSAQPEHVTLARPIDGQIVYFSELLTIEMRRLTPFEDHRGDVWGQHAQA